MGSSCSLRLCSHQGGIWTCQRRLFLAGGCISSCWVNTSSTDCPNFSLEVKSSARLWLHNEKCAIAVSATPISLVYTPPWFDTKISKVSQPFAFDLDLDQLPPFWSDPIGNQMGSLVGSSHNIFECSIVSLFSSQLSFFLWGYSCYQTFRFWRLLSWEDLWVVGATCRRRGK